ncbi:MAG: PD-(D/E)XK nuclease family transposase [Anaerolineaceae bacterium]|nr:PD-(D/E)XK nuclease family transposase [Anaerolineaceae bacterium]
MSRTMFSESTNLAVKRLVPIDDAMFQKICENKATIQEIISTILNQNVKVISVIPQDSIGNLQGRSIRLDCLCILENGSYVNVEVQKSDDDDHEERVRYNASVITANRTPKGVKFKDITQVIVIYITRFDIFGDNLPIYHIDRVVRETGKIRSSGFSEIYVNAAVKNYENSLNTNVSDLMDLFVDRNTYNPEKFPNFSNRKNDFINTEEGEIEMSETLEQYYKQREHDYMMTLLFEGVQDGGVKVSYAAKKAELSVAEFKKLMVMKGFVLPKRNSRSVASQTK